MGAVRRLGCWLKRVFWTRRAASMTLVVLASLLALFSAFAIYLREVVLDTPTWADTNAQMPEDDRIRPVLAEHLVDANTVAHEQLVDAIENDATGRSSRTPHSPSSRSS